MIKNDWWIDFYNDEYADCTLTHDTAPIVHFLIQQCQLKPEMHLFDQCCGKGFLSHSLSDEGIRVSGVDGSRSYVDFATTNYQTETCRFFHGDAREYVLPEPADVAVNWNTSFGNSEDDEENRAMLSGFSKNLKPGGQFVISTMNPDYILANFQRFIVRYVDYEDSNIIAIRESYLENEMLKSDWLFVFPDGKRIQRYGQTKLYRLADFERMLATQGLVLEKAFGDIYGEVFHLYSPSMILYGKKQCD